MGCLPLSPYKSFLRLRIDVGRAGTDVSLRQRMKSKRRRKRKIRRRRRRRKRRRRRRRGDGEASLRGCHWCEVLATSFSFLGRIKTGDPSSASPSHLTHQQCITSTLIIVCYIWKQIEQKSFTKFLF